MNFTDSANAQALNKFPKTTDENKLSRLNRDLTVDGGNNSFRKGAWTVILSNEPVDVQQPGSTIAYVAFPVAYYGFDGARLGDGTISVNAFAKQYYPKEKSSSSPERAIKNFDEMASTLGKTPKDIATACIEKGYAFKYEETKPMFVPTWDSVNGRNDFNNTRNQDCNYFSAQPLPETIKTKL